MQIHVAQELLERLELLAGSDRAGRIWNVATTLSRRHAATAVHNAYRAMAHFEPYQALVDHADHLFTRMASGELAPERAAAQLFERIQAADFLPQPAAKRKSACGTRSVKTDHSTM